MIDYQIVYRRNWYEAVKYCSYISWHLIGRKGLANFVSIMSAREGGSDKMSADILLLTFKRRERKEKIMLYFSNSFIINVFWLVPCLIWIFLQIAEKLVILSFDNLGRKNSIMFADISRALSTDACKNDKMFVVKW